MRRVQATKVGKEVLDLRTCIPVAKSVINNIQMKIEHISKMVTSIFGDDQLKQEFGHYVIGNVHQPNQRRMSG